MTQLESSKKRDTVLVLFDRSCQLKKRHRGGHRAFRREKTAEGRSDKVRQERQQLNGRLENTRSLTNKASLERHKAANQAFPVHGWQ